MKNKNIHIAAEKRTISFSLALLIHAILLIFLFFGVHWQSRPIVPLEVEMWSGMPTILSHAHFSDMLKPPHVIQDTPPSLQQAKPETLKELPNQAQPPHVMPDIVEEKRLLKDKTKTKEGLEKKAPPTTQQEKPIEKKKPAHNPLKHKKENDHALEIQNLLRKAATQSKQDRSTTAHHLAAGLENGAAQRAYKGKESQLDGYLQQLKQIIRDKTIYTDNGAASSSAVLKVFVLPDGTIRDVQIVNVIGDPNFAYARKQALLIMQRLPPLPPGMFFSEQREWTIHTRLRE